MISKFLWPIPMCFLAGLWASGATADLPASMVTGGETTQPIGHYEMCEDTPRECGRTPRADPIAITPTTWALLESVNGSVNASVRAVTDVELYGELEVWAYPTRAGDCEDFVLLKRRLLNEAGWPLADLLITMVFRGNGEGHAVLTVRTDQGDYVLDNLTNEVRLWWETGYRFVKRQSERDAGSWVSIRQVSAPAIAAVQVHDGFGPIGGAHVLGDGDAAVVGTFGPIQ